MVAGEMAQGLESPTAPPEDWHLRQVAYNCL